MNCEAVGILIKNGGAEIARRAWKFKICAKQISEQLIPDLFETQFLVEWRVEVAKAYAPEAGESINTAAKCETTPKKDCEDTQQRQFVTVSRIT